WYSDQRLGLAISRKLARLMGGQLYFETSPTAGTRFFFSVPLEVSTEEDTTEAEVPVTSGSDHAVAGRILVAEDNKINVLVIRTILEKQGYQVTTVHTGQEAVAALEHGSFDLVLMDISMPVMDGMTATRAIRGRRKDDRFDPDIPVIAISAHSMKGDRERFLEAGMNDYISKPFEQDTVIEVIRRNMRSRG
ncbi:MAG: response regulator, partial [Spirochaetaceae bacterium]